MIKELLKLRIDEKLKEATDIVLTFVQDLDEGVYNASLQNNQIYLDYLDKLNYYSTK